MKNYPYLTDTEKALNSQFRFEVRTRPSSDRSDETMLKYQIFSKATDKPVNNHIYHSWHRADRECAKMHLQSEASLVGGDTLAGAFQV